MNKENTKYLFNNFSFFDPQNPQSCMIYGFDCGDGWFDLVKELCVAIEKLNLGKEFEVGQVKEKFGGLRFYVQGVPENKSKIVDSLIMEAERKSFSTCENCGASGETVSKEDWLKTLCETHYNNW